MSRIYENDEGLPWEMWNRTVSLALGSERGQRALAAMEDALLALPDRRLIEGKLVAEGGVCAVGALAARMRAQEQGLTVREAIDAMAAEVDDPEYQSIHDTVDEGTRVGLAVSVAWHFAYLNDEQFYALTPEERYERMLAWVRRAQGKEAVAA